MQESILSVLPRLSSNLILILAAGALLNVLFAVLKIGKEKAGWDQLE